MGLPLVLQIFCNLFFCFNFILQFFFLFYAFSLNFDPKYQGGVLRNIVANIAVYDVLIWLKFKRTKYLCVVLSPARKVIRPLLGFWSSLSVHSGAGFAWTWGWLWQRYDPHSIQVPLSCLLMMKRMSRMTMMMMVMMLVMLTLQPGGEYWWCWYHKIMLIS